MSFKNNCPLVTSIIDKARELGIITTPNPHLFLSASHLYSFDGDLENKVALCVHKGKGVPPDILIAPKQVEPQGLAYYLFEQLSPYFEIKSFSLDENGHNLIIKVDGSSTKTINVVNHTVIIREDFKTLLSTDWCNTDLEDIKSVLQKQGEY